MHIVKEKLISTQKVLAPDFSSIPIFSMSYRLISPFSLFQFYCVPQAKLTNSVESRNCTKARVEAKVGG